MTINQQLAYVAGLLDGDGCIRLQDREALNGKTFSLRLQLRMNAKRCVEKALGLLPGHIDQDKARNAWVYAAASNHAATALRRVYPWLMTKRRQAAFAIQFQEHVALLRNWSPRVKGQAGGGSIPEPILQFRSYLANEICDDKHRQSDYLNSVEFRMKVVDKVAYSAGLMDAEGCIVATADLGIRLKIKMFDISPLRRARVAIGGQVTENCETEEGKLPMSALCIDDADSVLVALKKIRPLLLAKREQADLAIMMINSKRLWRRKLGLKANGKLPADKTDQLHQWADRIRSLNGGKPASRAGAETKLPQA